MFLQFLQHLVRILQIVEARLILLPVPVTHHEVKNRGEESLSACLTLRHAAVDMRHLAVGNIVGTGHHSPAHVDGFRAKTALVIALRLFPVCLQFRIRYRCLSDCLW